MIRRIGLAFIIVMGFLILVAEVQRFDNRAAAPAPAARSASEGAA